MQSVKTGRSKWAHQNAIFIMRFTICGGSPTDRYFGALKRQILVVFLPICSNLKTGRRSAVSGRSYFNSIDNPSTSATKPMVFKAISPGRFGSGRAGPGRFPIFITQSIDTRYARNTPKGVAPRIDEARPRPQGGQRPPGVQRKSRARIKRSHHFVIPQNSPC